MTNIPTTEDRIWAVLSHLSALALGMGILLPIIGWSEQRRKSKYASFQCLQALGYQSLGYTIWILFSLFLLIILSIIVLIVLGSPGGNGSNANAFAAIWTGILMGFIFGLIAIYFVPPIVAAIACALGKDFRYPIIGNRLARYLGYNPTQSKDEQVWLIEDHEDRWVAAVGHFSVIIIFWGMLAPLAAWILQGKHSLFLKFQSMQTLVYQAAVNILYLGAGIIYLVGLFALLVVSGFTGGPDLNSSLSIISLIVFGTFMLLALVIVLIVPLFHILGQWAGYRVLKSDDYQYPLIGKFVNRQFSKQAH